MHSVDSENVHTDEAFPKNATDFRSNYIFNTTIAGIEKADLVLLVRYHMAAECVRVQFN